MDGLDGSCALCELRQREHPSGHKFCRLTFDYWAFPVTLGAIVCYPYTTISQQPPTSSSSSSSGRITSYNKAQGQDHLRLIFPDFHFIVLEIGQKFISFLSIYTFHSFKWDEFLCLVNPPPSFDTPSSPPPAHKLFHWLFV